MEVSYRLLILSSLPIPGWITGLKDKIEDAGISTQIHTSLNEISSSSNPLLNLSDKEIETNAPVLTLSISDKSKSLKKGLSVIEVSTIKDNQKTVLIQASLSKFKNEDDTATQTAYVVCKALQLLERGVAPPSETKNFANPASKKSGVIDKIIRLFTRDNWLIGIINAPLDEVALSGNRFEVTPVIAADLQILRADPFGVRANDREFIFYEKQLKGKKGTIACFHDGKEQLLLEKPWHLSFPSLLEEDGSIYCVPEQQESSRTDLYRFDPLHCTLKYVSTLLENFSATDPVLLKYTNRYWIFCTDSKQNGANSRLHIFHSERLDGPWEPHAMNPVKISVVGSRPAGAFFTHLGSIYRPAQDCSVTYGGAIQIYRIDQLDEHHYSETLSVTLNPDLFGAGFAGIHTLSPLGNRTLIDLKQKVFSFRNILHLLRKK